MKETREFKVLAYYVSYSWHEEESELLPTLSEAGSQAMDDISEEYARRHRVNPKRPIAEGELSASVYDLRCSFTLTREEDEEEGTITWTNQFGDEVIIDPENPRDLCYWCEAEGLFDADRDNARPPVETFFCKSSEAVEEENARLRFNKMYGMTANVIR